MDSQAGYKVSWAKKGWDTLWAESRVKGTPKAMAALLKKHKSSIEKLLKQIAPQAVTVAEVYFTYLGLKTELNRQSLNMKKPLGELKTVLNTLAKPNKEVLEKLKKLKTEAAKKDTAMRKDAATLLKCLNDIHKKMEYFSAPMLSKT